MDSQDSDGDTLLKQVLARYESFYDIEYTAGKHELPLSVIASCHMTNEKYVLSPKAKLWSAGLHDYSYFFTTQTLSEELFQHCTSYALELGMQKIHPDSNHMCSTITAIFLVDTPLTTSQETLVKKIRKHKDFRFSFYGWMDFRAVVLIRQTLDVLTNAKGRDLKKLYDFKKKNQEVKK